MFQLYSREADFEAEVTILTAEQDGRKTPVFNGIRWDFRYSEDQPSDGVYMIHPYFLDQSRAHIPKENPLSGTMPALMLIVIDDMIDFHRKRISVGSGFFCVEGSHICANGRVTKLLELNT